jgi:hypothetical protein
MFDNSALIEYRILMLFLTLSNDVGILWLFYCCFKNDYAGCCRGLDFSAVFPKPHMCVAYILQCIAIKVFNLSIKKV